MYQVPLEFNINFEHLWKTESNKLECIQNKYSIPLSMSLTLISLKSFSDFKLSDEVLSKLEWVASIMVLKDSINFDCRIFSLLPIKTLFGIHAHWFNGR